MISEQWPTVQLVPIKSITASRYPSFELCKLKTILSHNNQEPFIPVHPSARLGQISHKMLELTIRRNIVDERGMELMWDKETGRIEGSMLNNPIEKHLVPLKLSVPDFEVKKLMTFNLIKMLLSEVITIREEKGTPLLEAEKWFKTSDGKVCGVIDLIAHTANGLEIIDYKTGSVLDDLSDNPSPKIEFQQQLKLYAALFHDTTGEWPDKLIIRDLDKNEYAVDFNENECMQILNSAKKELDEINRKILTGSAPEEFATPNPKACRYCVYRPRCKMYWMKRENDDQWPNDVVGVVEKKIVLGNGLLKVVIKGDDGNSLAIRGLSPYRYPFLRENIKVMFCNLKKEKIENTYTENRITVGYPLVNNQ